MIHVCIMSGHEGLLRLDRKIYLTLFGGCSLIRPTVARQLLESRRTPDATVRRRRPFFITICGGVEIKVPTLAEEYIDLRELVAAGTLSLDDWDRAVAELGDIGGSIGSFTLMGGLSESGLPTEAQEIDALAIQRHLGNINDDAAQILPYGIGQRDGERRATIRRALAAAV